MERKKVIDVDDVGSWPGPVAAFARTWAAKLGGTTEYTGDLAIPLELEDSFRQLLAGHLLRTYHCTRLLPHEVHLLRERGLRLLTAQLVRERIEAACVAGDLSRDLADCLHASHVFAKGEEQYRENQVCLVLSVRTFSEQPEGVKPLLGTWGGEALYRSSGSSQTSPDLKKLGIPTVVAALLDLTAPGKHLFFPSLHKVFTGALLGLRGQGADVFYRSPVPPDCIEAIHQPGSPPYKNLGNLPTI